MKRCKNCNNRFKPRFSTLERFCWVPECKTMEAMEKLAKIKRMEAKKQRADLKQRKKALETVQNKMKKTQHIVNRYIRERDQGKQCITCAKILVGKFDAGHYYPAGSCFSIRFDPVNINGQCVRCNRDLHGNLIPYRESIKDRWGISELIRLDSMAKTTRKFTRDELDQIADQFKKRTRDLIKKNKL